MHSIKRTNPVEKLSLYKPTNTAEISIPVGFIRKIEMNETLTVHEGSDVTMECLVDAISITGNIDFQWTFNGSLIKPTTTSRLQLFKTKMSNTKFNSTLLMRDIRPTDTGKIDL